VLALATGCGSTPTAPSDRFGSPAILLRCNSGSASALNCTAPVSCSLYPCRPGVPTDVTGIATWTTDDPSVARVTGPGVIVAAGPGNTVVRATSAGVSEGFQYVAVFAGTAPLPTFRLQGIVYEGPTSNDGKIDGAIVEVIEGLIAGRTATSGAPPAVVPGFPAPGPAAPGLFIINGMPPGHSSPSREEGWLCSGRARCDLYVRRRATVNFQLQRQ
jgi:hypothetical protein